MKSNRILPVLFITLLLDMIGIGMLIPIIPSLFTDPSSHSFLLGGYSVSSRYVIAGLVTAIFGFMQFVASPILGELSDMYGRKKLLTIGVAVLAISQLLFATGIAFGSLLLLFVSRAIAGIAGANFSIAQAAIADVTLPEDRARNFGLIGAAFGIGFILGPLLGGVLAGATGNPSVPFVCAGILGIVNVLLVTFFLSETHHVRTLKTKISFFRAIHHIQGAFKDKDARPLYFASFFVMLGFAFYTSFISVFLVEKFGFTEIKTGAYFGIVGIWIVFAQVVMVRALSKKYSDRLKLLYALPILSAVIVIQPFVTHQFFLYVLMPFTAGSFAIVSTSIPALVSKGVGKDKQGTALGINSSFQALSQAIGPLASGFAAGVLGLTTSFVLGSLFVAISFCIVFFRTKQL